MVCDPTCNPQLLSTTSEPDTALILNFYLDSSEIILCYATALGVRKWNISTPSLPVDLGAYTKPSGFAFSRLCSKGTDLFIIDQESDSRQHVISVDSTTSPPSLIQDIDTGEDVSAGISGPACLGNRLYFGYANGSGQRFIGTVNITNPASMSFLGRYDPTGVFNGVSFLIVDPGNQNTLFVMGNDFGGDLLLTIYDTTVPSAFTTIGSLTATGVAFNNGGFAEAYLSAGFLYVPYQDSTTKGFLIVDVSNPATPTLLSTTPTSGNPNEKMGLFVLNDNLFIHEQNSGNAQFEVWNVSNKLVPVNCKIVVEAGLSATGAILSTALSMESIVGFTDEFKIYDVATCGASAASGFVACRALGSSPGYLFIADQGAKKLRTYNVIDPQNPSQIGSGLSLAKAPSDVALSNGLVYVAADGARYVVKIDDINVPVLAASIDAIGGTEDRIAISGGQAFSSGATANVQGYQLDQAEASLLPKAKIVKLDQGTSLVAFDRLRMFFADLTTSNFARLRGYLIGGFACHHILTGDLYAGALDAELIRSRHVELKGDLVTDTVTVYTEITLVGKSILAGSGNPNGVFKRAKGSIFMSDDGNVYRNTDGATAWTTM